MPQSLLEGLHQFKTGYFPRYEARFKKLIAEGQSPRALFIGCSDSRVVPDRLTSTEPGDLFVVRNVGNIIPPFNMDHEHHSVSAALEFAVENLGVQDIIICGHSHCGAIRALYHPPPEHLKHMRQWLRFAEGAKLSGEVTPGLLRQTEQRSIIVQLDRLMTFPIVRECVEAGKIALHGWYYVIEAGEVHIFDFEEKKFLPAV